MSEVINFYTTDRIKKKLPKEKDHQFDYTNMKINSRFLIAGSSGTGKTNALMNYIYLTGKPKGGTFTHIFLCCKVSEVLYDDLIEQVGDAISVYYNGESFPECNRFKDNPKDKYLCIFDDCVNDQDVKSVKKINEYFTFSRKKGVTCCFITQSYFDTPTFIRKNMNYLLLLSISGMRDLTSILKEFNLGNYSNEELIHIYDSAIKKKNDKDLPFLKIVCDHLNDKSKKFGRNFTDYNFLK